MKIVYTSDNPISTSRHFVVENEDGSYTTCDTEGCAPGLYHRGDTYDSIETAKTMADFWCKGGHWMDRPDMQQESKDVPD